MPYSTRFSTRFDPAPDSAPDSELDSAPDSFYPIVLYIDSLLKIHSYLTKTSYSSLLLKQQLFLYWSPVGLKKGKYSDHLSELAYENKCSVPPGKF